MRARSVARDSRWAQRPTALALARAPASAVIIDSDDGTGNTTAPVPDDPGWSNVGYEQRAHGRLPRRQLRADGQPRRRGQHRARRRRPTRTCPGTAVQLDNGDGTLRRSVDVPDPSRAARCRRSRSRASPPVTGTPRDHGRPRRGPRAGDIVDPALCRRTRLRVGTRRRACAGVPIPCPDCSRRRPASTTAGRSRPVFDPGGLGTTKPRRPSGTRAAPRSR